MQSICNQVHVNIDLKMVIPRLMHIDSRVAIVVKYHIKKMGCTEGT